MAISQKPMFTRTCKKRKAGSFLFVLFFFDLWFWTLEVLLPNDEIQKLQPVKKNECEYEIIYWKKHSWSSLFEVIQRATRKALSHAPIARRRVHTSSCFLLLSTRYQFVNKITKQSSILSNFWRLTWKLSLQPSFSSCDICWVVFYNQ